MYSVMDTEGSVDRSFKEPAVLPLWIACCGERQVRNEVKPSVCDMSVRNHVVRWLLSQNVVCYLHGVRCRVCDVCCPLSPRFVCRDRDVWCSCCPSFLCCVLAVLVFPELHVFICSLLKEFDDLFW